MLQFPFATASSFHWLFERKIWRIRVSGLTWGEERWGSELIEGSGADLQVKDWIIEPLQGGAKPPAAWYLKQRGKVGVSGSWRDGWNIVHICLSFFLAWDLILCALASNWRVLTVLWWDGGRLVLGDSGMGRSTRCAQRCGGSYGSRVHLGGPWHKFRSQIWGRRWGRQCTRRGTSSVRRYRHVRERGSRGAITESSHWVIKLASLPKVAHSTLLEMSADRSTLKINSGKNFTFNKVKSMVKLMVAKQLTSWNMGNYKKEDCKCTLLRAAQQLAKKRKQRAVEQARPKLSDESKSMMEHSHQKRNKNMWEQKDFGRLICHEI